MLKTFSNIPDYSIRYKLVYAKDYGVPQNRPRVLVVGKRNDIQGKFGDEEDAVLAGYLPFPTSDYPDIQDVFSDLVDPKFEYGGVTTSYPSAPKNKWQEQIRTLPDGKDFGKSETLSEHQYSKHSDTVVEILLYDWQYGEFPSTLRQRNLLNDCFQRHGETKVQRLPPVLYQMISFTTAISTFVNCEGGLFTDVSRLVSIAGKRTTGGLRRAGNPRSYF